MRTVLFIVWKELTQVFRDRIMLVQIFVPPILQLLIMSQAMTFEVHHTDLALVDLDNSVASDRLVEEFTSTGRFDISVRTASADRADETLLTREANAVLRIPEGFERVLLMGGQPGVQLILNAEDGAAAGVVQSYASQIIAGFTAAEAGPRPGIQMQTRTLYNPQRVYLGYMAIGLLASLMTIVGILLTSQNIAREKEIGTLEQLNVTPISRGHFIAGKLLPFMAIGLVELSIGLVLIRFIFDIPFVGSVFLVYLAAVMYLMAALGLGLLISTVVSTQQQAQFITFFVLVTFFFLGGIFTPVDSMPGWAQTLASLNPIKHFVVVLRTVLMKGGTFFDVANPLGAMVIFAGGALTVALLRYRKTAA